MSANPRNEINRPMITAGGWAALTEIVPSVPVSWTIARPPLSTPKKRAPRRSSSAQTPVMFVRT